MSEHCKVRAVGCSISLLKSQTNSDLCILRNPQAKTGNKDIILVYVNETFRTLRIMMIIISIIIYYFINNYYNKATIANIH